VLVADGVLFCLAGSRCAAGAATGACSMLTGPLCLSWAGKAACCCIRQAGALTPAAAVMQDKETAIKAMRKSAVFQNVPAKDFVFGFKIRVGPRPRRWPQRVPRPGSRAAERALAAARCWFGSGRAAAAAASMRRWHQARARRCPPPAADGWGGRRWGWGCMQGCWVLMW
jgi:hypothetical protein